MQARSKNRAGAKLPKRDISSSIWHQRLIDYRRHIDDLRCHSYEGAKTRAEREAMFQRAFELLTPIAEGVLFDLNLWFLRGTGIVATQRPSLDQNGGLDGAWTLTWPLQQQARSRFTHERLQPLALHAMFPLRPTLGMEWTHPHLVLPRSGCKEGLAAAWPLQVTSPADARRQEPVLRVLAEAELHEKTFLADLNWRLLASFCDDCPS